MKWDEWWQEASANAYGALAFYPLLSMFIQFEKVIKGESDASMQIALIYLFIWIMTITGKIWYKLYLRTSKTKLWDKLDPYGAKSIDQKHPYDIRGLGRE